MKKTMRVLVASLCLVSTLRGNALACTGILVGKDVSADGSRLMGRTEDISAAYNKNFIAVPATDSPDEVTFVDEVNGFTLALPGTACAYTMTPDVPEHEDGLYASGCMNEYGVAISATISCGLSEAAMAADPPVENGLREASLPTVIIPYVKTAREAVLRLGGIVETLGSEAGNTVFIGDAQETWYMELLSGHQWAAVKVPDDVYAVVPNCFMLGAIDLADSENVLASPAVLSMPEEKGFLQTWNGQPHLALTYGAPLADGNRVRAWGGRHFFSPSTAVAYESDVFELFMKPDEKISLQDAMALMRYRYEDTAYDANLNPDIRAIGTERTCEAHIYQFIDGVPTLQWQAMGNPEHSVFLPAFAGLSETPAAYQVPGTAYRPDAAYWTFRAPAALAELDRVNYGAGVRAYWAAYEAKLIAAQDGINAQMAALTDPAAASAFANAQFAAISADAMARADQLYAGLVYTIARRAGAAAMRSPFAPAFED